MNGEKEVVQRDPQIQMVRSRLLEQTVKLEEVLHELSVRLTDIRHSNEIVSDINKDVMVENYVPLAKDMNIVLERVDTSIEVVRKLIETIEI